MHSHDDALIAALAEGSIDPSQAGAAEAQIAACPRCLAELEGQRRALAALQAAPAALLRDDERASLRVAVAAALGMEAEPAPRAAPRKAVPWGAIAIAAASLAAIVAVVPLAGLLGTAADSDDAATALAVTTAQDAQIAPGDDPAPGAGLLEAPAADHRESAAGGDGEVLSQPGTEPEPLSSTTTTGAARALTMTVDELAAALAQADLVAGPEAEDAPPCSTEARALLGPDAAPLAHLVVVGDVAGIAYLSGDGSSAAVFDLDTCLRLALLP